ncbi:MAG: hypothetical protein M3R08_05650 [Bacteroidota bacterium]|nr:hypothetical protein [Bacteroidota bacterium]
MFQFRSKLAATVALLILFTGCLTIEENYTFKKNGSGTMEYVVDMSEVGEMMKTLGEMAEAEGSGKPPDDMGTLDMNDELIALKKIPGIKRVKLDAKKKWVQRLKFNFKDVTALNAALNILMSDSSGVPHTFFTWDGSTLVRTNNKHAYELGSSMAKAEEASSEEDGMEGEQTAGDPLAAGEGMDIAFLEAMKYKYSFKFAEEISNTETAEGITKEAKGAREVKFDTDWSVISKDEKALDLKIQLSR